MSPLDRRSLLRSSAAATGALALSRFATARGSDRLRVGLVGCGGRGTGAAQDILQAAEGIELVALGDLFPERVAGATRSLAEVAERAGKPDAFRVTPETSFSGWDAAERVIASDIDVVLLATPPHFRPGQLARAVERGLHVFMEKPVAVDAPGVRSVLHSADVAAAKGLSIVAGTQRRHQRSYQETLQRIRDGALGEIVGGNAWWNQGGLWMHPREEAWSDMEWQLRNWLYFTWASGDHICEQHVHNLDVILWALDGVPVRATAMGGREVRKDPAYGNVFDHFAVQYEFANGVLIESHCRQIDGCANRVGERLVGTLGVADPSGSIRSAKPWRFEGEQSNPYVQEHVDLVRAIRTNEPINEARQIALSTMTAILGRMSAYTGQTLGFEEALASTEDLTPPAYEFGDLPVAPVAVPGQTLFS